MEDLLHLDTCRLKGELSYSARFGQVDSPFQWQKWVAWLSSYPDQRLRAYIVKGICHGFRMGYNSDATCRPSRGNMKSALENPQVIRDYLGTECKAG